jgi:hypothetical protein
VALQPHDEQKIMFEGLIAVAGCGKSMLNA